MSISDPNELAPWAWFRRDAGLWQNAARTIPAAAPGDLIHTWGDQSGNGRHLTQPTSGDRPFAALDPGDGGPTVEFRGSEYLAIPSLAAWTQGEALIVLDIDADPPASGGRTGLWTLGTAGDSTHYPWTDGTIYDGALTTARKTIGNIEEDLTAVHLYGVSSKIGEWTARLNGRTIRLELTSMPGFATSARLGLSAGSGSYFLAARVRYFFLFDRVLSLSERSDLHAWLLAANPEIGEIAGPVQAISSEVTPGDLGFTPADDLGTIYAFAEEQGCTVLRLPAVVASINPVVLGEWDCLRPVNVRRGNIAIEGSNKNTTVVEIGWQGGLHLGRKTPVVGTDLGLDHWVDIDDLFDGSVSNRIGFRSYLSGWYGTHGHFCSLAMPFSPFSTGPTAYGWRAGVEGGATWCLRFKSHEADGRIARGTYIGSGEGQYLGTPLMLASDGAGNLRIDIGTGQMVSPVQHSFRVFDDSPPGAPGGRSIYVYADPAAGEIWCAIDGIVKQVSASNAGSWTNGSNYPAGAGSTWGTAAATFLGCETSAVVLGVKNSHGWIQQDSGQNGGPNPSEWVPGDSVKPDGEWQPTLDVVWCGLHLTEGRRFEAGTVGGPVAWLAGGPEDVAGDTLNDLNVFFGNRSNLMGCILFNSPVGSLTLRGMVGPAANTLGNGNFPVYLVPRMQRFGAAGGQALKQIDIRNITFRFKQGDYCCPIVNYGTTFVRIENCDTSGTPIFGFADSGQAATWMHQIKDSDLSSHVAGVQSCQASIKMDDVRARYNGLFAVVFAGNLWGDGLFLYPSDSHAKPISVFAMNSSANGGEFHVSRSMVDIELGEDHHFLVAQANAGLGSNISISEIGLTLGGNSAKPLVLLDGRAGKVGATPIARQTIRLQSVGLVGAGIAGGTPMVAVQNDPAGLWRGYAEAPAGVAKVIEHEDGALAEANFDAAIAGTMMVWTTEEKETALGGLVGIAAALGQPAVTIADDIAAIEAGGGTDPAAVAAAIGARRVGAGGGTLDDLFYRLGSTLEEVDGAPDGLQTFKEFMNTEQVAMTSRNIRVGGLVRRLVQAMPTPSPDTDPEPPEEGP